MEGSCCNSLWMRFLARGPIREGMWYSFFFILHRKDKIINIFININYQKKIFNLGLGPSVGVLEGLCLEGGLAHEEGVEDAADGPDVHLRGGGQEGAEEGRR